MTPAPLADVAHSRANAGSKSREDFMIRFALRRASGWRGPGQLPARGRRATEAIDASIRRQAVARLDAQAPTLESLPRFALERRDASGRGRLAVAPWVGVAIGGCGQRLLHLRAQQSVVVGRVVVGSGVLEDRSFTGGVGRPCRGTGERAGDGSGEKQTGVVHGENSGGFRRRIQRGFSPSRIDSTRASRRRTIDEKVPGPRS